MIRRACAFPLFLFASLMTMGGQTTVSGAVQVVNEKGLPQPSANVVIWLVPLDTAPPAPPLQRTYRLTQKDKHFSPHLLVVPLGASVQFPNKDPFFHNVFSVYNGTRFDLGLYESGSSKMVRFNRPGPSYIFCNIHPEMSAVVLALNTPYFAVSDTLGNYRIEGIPVGHYELNLWSDSGRPEQFKELARGLTVPTTGLQLPAIKITQRPSMAEHHKNKFGKDYEPAPDYRLP